ncbi:MAG TPA: hypothetical protein VNL71_22180 [Chloroflexota bacterium]|nr:hypothetical protein [Chloroflexota bacterium]
MATLTTRHALGTMALVALTWGLVGPRAAGEPAQAHQGGASCAALGVYHVGRTIPPPIIPLPQGSIKGGAPTTTAIAYPFLGGGVLTGTITLSSYTACGSPTAGSFSVALSQNRIPLPMASTSGAPVTGQTTITSTLTLVMASSTVLTATGTFKQDRAHPNDPVYLSVSGSATYGRYVLGCPPLCGAQKAPDAPMCVPVGCKTGETVSRVSNFTGITGYLRVQPAGSGALASLALDFLPPPDPKAASPDVAMSFMQPVSLVGTRLGGGANP